SSGFQPTLSFRDTAGAQHKIEIPFLDRQLAEAFAKSLPVKASTPATSPSSATGALSSPAVRSSPAASAPASPPWVVSSAVAPVSPVAAAQFVAAAAPVLPASPYNPPPLDPSLVPPTPGPATPLGFVPNPFSSATLPTPATAQSTTAASVVEPSQVVTIGDTSSATTPSTEGLDELDDAAARAIEAHRWGEAKQNLIAYAARCEANERAGTEACIRAVDDLAAHDIDSAFYTLAIDQVYWQSALDSLLKVLEEELSKKSDRRAHLARLFAAPGKQDEVKEELNRKGVNIDELEERVLQDAIRHFTLKSSHYQNNARFHYELARAYIDDIEYEEALGPATLALKLEPKSIPYALAVAQCLLELERVDEGEGLLRAAIDSRTTDIRPHLMLADLYASSNRGDDALALLTSTAELAPTDPGLHSALEDVLEETAPTAVLLPRLKALFPSFPDELRDAIAQAESTSSPLRSDLKHQRDFRQAPPPNRAANPWDRPPDSTPRGPRSLQRVDGKLSKPSSNQINPVVFGFAALMVLAVVIRFFIMHK
ncbi:MAG: CDC27 family protein, partial [Polyangiaceae bacterium]